MTDISQQGFLHQIGYLVIGSFAIVALVIGIYIGLGHLVGNTIAAYLSLGIGIILWITMMISVMKSDFARKGKSQKLTIKRARETKYGDLVLDFGTRKLFKVAGVEYPTTASGNLTISLDSTILNEAGVTDNDTIDLAYDKLMSFLVTHEVKQDTKSINEDPTQALRLRLAKGEITKEEYEELRKIVEP